MITTNSVEDKQKERTKKKSRKLFHVELRKIEKIITTGRKEGKLKCFCYLVVYGLT